MRSTLNPTLFSIPADRRSWLIYVAFMATLTAVLFGSLRHHPLGIDDESTFRDNISISDNFWYFFQAPEDKELGSGRPLAELTKWVVYAVGGNDPGVFHMLVVAIHALASILLAAVAARLGSNLETSFLGGMLFLANAAHFSAVHWISAMDYPLALLWGLAALACFGEHLKSSRIPCLVVFHVCLILGLLSHMAAAAVVPVCLYLSFLHGVRLRGSISRLVPATLMAAGISIASLSFTSEDTTTWLALDPELGESGAALGDLLRAALWLPGRLVSTAHWMPTPLHEQHGWELLLGAGSLAGMAWLIWKTPLPGSLWSIWTVCTLAPFVPVTLVHSGISRYIYLASAGSSMLLAWLLQRGSCWVAMRNKVVGSLIFPMIVLAVLLSSYVALKKTELVSLYRSGRYYFAAGDDRRAAQLIRQGLDGAGDLIPRDTAYIKLITLAVTSGEDYAGLLRDGLSAFPDDFNLKAVLAVTESLSEDAEIRTQGTQAIAELEQIADHHDRFAHVMAVTNHNMGHRYRVLNQNDLAIQAFERSLSYEPARINSAQGLAWALFDSERFSRAAETAMEVALRMPDSSEYLYLAARSLKEDGRLQHATEVCNLGLMTQPTGELYLLLGRIYSDLGDDESANKALEKATAFR